MQENPAYPDVLVIRHCETQWNKQGRLQGRNDSPLTLNGIRQAQALAIATRPYLPDIDAAHFWVSPLFRARQTASILADAWKLSFSLFEVDPALAERAYGTWEGHTLAEVERKFPAEFRAHEADPWGYCIPNGENRNTLTERLHRWLSGLDASVPHVIVTHSGCLRTLRGIYTQADASQILKYREPQTTSYWLSCGRERAIDIDPAVLNIFCCEGGSTVGI